MELHYQPVRWQMKEPFVIANQRYDHLDALQIELIDDAGNSGRSECCGVDYQGETVDSITAQIRMLEPALREGIDRLALQNLLPPGGARNGLDCALWDLETARSGKSVWRTLELEPQFPVETAYTIGVVSLAAAEERAHEIAARYRDIKLKVDSSGSLATVAAVREACPDARLILDANGSWSDAVFCEAEPQLLELEVALLEQPFAPGEDDFLLDYDGPLRVGADESLNSREDLSALVGKYEVLNIKLDKAGGLTESLRLTEAARKAGFSLMVGNMCGSSLAMAPALVVAQFCEFVDLDGPLLQRLDHEPALQYQGGQIFPPASVGLWGGI